jgi:hypothetical protein
LTWAKASYLETVKLQASLRNCSKTPPSKAQFCCRIQTLDAQVPPPARKSAGLTNRSEDPAQHEQDTA